MYNISNEFADLLRRSHTVVTKCEVLDSNYVLQGVLTPTDGNVNVDRGADIRRRCNVTLVDNTETLTPDEADDLLHPLSNNRLRLFRGILLPDGTEELISLGVFDIFDSNISDSGEKLEIEVRGFDLSKSVQRARLLNNYHVPAGTRYDLAIRDLLSFKVPTLSFNIPTINFYTPPLVFGASGDQGGGDPWKYASEMAEAVGYEIYFDTQGIVNMNPIPDPTQDPVAWEYKEGVDSMLLYIEKRTSKEDVYSRVVATGENSDLDEPVKGEAIDDDPNSPTYIHGPFGDVPFFLRSEYIETVAQANEVAAAKLRQSQGVYEGLQIIATPNPAHEAGDILLVERAKTKVSSTYVLERFNVQLNVTQSNNMTLRKVG